MKALTDENKKLQKESVEQQARAEQEEEFISNTLLKKIQELKKEKVWKLKLTFTKFFISGNTSKSLWKGRRISNQSIDQENGSFEARESRIRGEFLFPCFISLVEKF